MSFSRTTVMWNIVIVFILVTISCSLGVADLYDESVASPTHNPIVTLVTHIDWQVIVHSRIPRTFAVLLTGSALAIAGLMLQVLFNNNYVEPSMVGTTQGASLGLLLVILIFPEASVLVKMLIAGTCGLLATYIFLKIMQSLRTASNLLVPLLGLVYSGILTAIATFIAFECDLLQMLEGWFHGSFSSVLLGRYELLWLSLAMAFFAYGMADRLSIAGLGKDMAHNLGLNYARTLQLGMIITTVIVATVVVTIGNIPFLGLVLPNIVRRFLGDNIRMSLPWVAYLGAVTLLTCDIVARAIHYPYEISVSLIMGLLGSMVFLYFLYKPQGVPRHE